MVNQYAVKVKIMNKHVLSICALLVTAFTCEVVELPAGFIDYIIRCENDEVICYISEDMVGGGNGAAGGISCKFKDEGKKK